MDLVIREAKFSELHHLIPTYKKSFPLHNIFQLSEREIKQYLHNSHKKSKPLELGYLVAVINGKVAGALLLKRTEHDQKGSHWTVKINHLAVHEIHRGKGIGNSLVKAAEEKFKALVKKGKARTIKIEVKVSDNERQALSFFKKLGFRQEGKLKSHFRAGELVYLMGKELF